VLVAVANDEEEEDEDEEEKKEEDVSGSTRDQVYPSLSEGVFVSEDTLVCMIRAPLLWAAG
jgi:hypothetical protein